MENTYKREPLFSNEECFQMAGKWGEPINEPEYCGGPIYYCVKEVSNLYEERLAKDAELIQTLLNALCLPIASIEAKKTDLEKAQDAIAAAKAAGFKPTGQ